MNTEIPAHKIGDTLSWAGTFELLDSAGAPISTAVGWTAHAVKVWTGAMWRQSPLRRWTGASWT